MTERSGVTVILLTFVTCGIYYFIWKYKTTEELKAASGDKEINPGMDLLLSILLCGIWAVFTDYRNAKKAYEILKANGSNRGDQSTIVILLHFLGLGFVSIYMLQEEYNAIAKLGRGQQLAALERRRESCTFEPCARWYRSSPSLSPCRPPARPRTAPPRRQERVGRAAAVAPVVPATPRRTAPPRRRRCSPGPTGTGTRWFTKSTCGRCRIRTATASVTSPG
jgi:hypothetical protein